MIDFDAVIETYKQDRRRFYPKGEIIELLEHLKTVNSEKTRRTGNRCLTP